MMGTQHTPGRLFTSYTNIGKVIAENGAVIAKCEKLTSLSQIEANARRIAACWNACEGFSTDALVSITDMGDTMLSRFEARNAEELKLCAANEVLMDAAQKMLEALALRASMPDDVNEAKKALEAAIVKATGEQA